MGRVVRIALHGCLMAAAATVYIAIVVPVARVRAAKRRRQGEKPAVFWGPVPLISISYWARAGRLYGYRSESVVYRVYPINSRDDFDIVLERYSRMPFLGRMVQYA